VSDSSPSGLPDDLPTEWRRAFDWIEAQLGGTIVYAERQPRWRPAWLLDLERDGERLPLYFRGDRGEADHGVYALEHEHRVLQVLEDNGIPVPHVYDFCPDPRGIVMERSAGRANLATAADQAERESVMDHYVEILAEIHSIDPAKFEAIGIRRPQSSEAIGLMDFAVWEAGYRKHKTRPEPAIEFAVQWIRRNVPSGEKRVCFVCADAGQFVFEDGRVTGVLDLELATLGEAAADWGGMRGRDLSEPLGDLARALRRYEKIVGAPLDRRSIDHHTVRFSTVTPLATAHLVAQAPAGLDLVQYMNWYVVYMRTPLEVIARGMKLELAPPQLPAPVAALAAPAPGFEAYEADRAACTALYQKRKAELGPALAADDVGDVARLLGGSFASSEAADAALERFVLEAPVERDAEILELLHRRLLRQEAILQPVMRELAGASIQSLD
jgi:aminoglycoside phosphotransferase (APT) family kinase protein